MSADGYFFDVTQDVVRLSQNRFQVTVWYGRGRLAPNRAITFIFPTDVPPWKLEEVLMGMAMERDQGMW